MHPSIKNAIEELDAALFTGDTFVDRDNRAVFKKTLGRWYRGVIELDQWDNETVNVEVKDDDHV